MCVMGCVGSSFCGTSEHLSLTTNRGTMNITMDTVVPTSGYSAISLHPIQKDQGIVWVDKSNYDKRLCNTGKATLDWLLGIHTCKW